MATFYLFENLQLIGSFNHASNQHAINPKLAPCF